MRRFIAASLGAAALAGCVKPEPPLLAIAPDGCDASPRFETAMPVPFDQSGGAVAKIGSQCLRDGPTTYVVFRLPEAPPYTLTITSLGTLGVLVLPRATLFDGEGRPGRVLTTQDFRTDVDGMRAGLRLKGGERWLLVQADRSRLGEPAVLRLGASGRTQVAAVLFIYIPPPTIPDVVRERRAVYALNGTIQVVAQPIPVVQ